MFNLSEGLGFFGKNKNMLNWLISVVGTAFFAYEGVGVFLPVL